MIHNTNQDFEKLDSMSVPAKRAAYSDRIAWMMALLADIVYERFDEESDDVLMSMAKDLSNLAADKKTSIDDIKKRLQKLALTLSSVGERNGENNKILKAALAAGHFSLVGDAPIHIPETDTQAMVIVRNATETEQPFAVLVFRGTQQVSDWFTNLETTPTPIVNPNVGDEELIGNMHKGFHNAYKSAEKEILERLAYKEVKDLPLYVTGHSLGGALAIVATWYLSSKQLAACYTFGAPRVGDTGLLGWFKTPIYRVVNAADPVPFAPPSGTCITGLKHLFRLLAAFIPWGGWLDRVVSFLVRQQKFRHYGDMKYLPFAHPIDGKYSKNFRIQPSISSISRLYRYVRMLFFTNAKPERVDIYHGIDRYRDKLRAVAINRNA